MDKKKFLYIGFAGLAVIFILIIVLGIIGGKSSQNTAVTETTADNKIAFTKPEATLPVFEVPASSSSSSVDEVVITNTEITTPVVPAENDEQFEALTKAAGYSSEDFDFNQLIIVESSGANAKLYAFEKINETWVKALPLDFTSGFVGSWGVSGDASEYASYTPAGLFSLGTGFGICDDPGTKLDYIKVTEDSYWVDDVNSAYYNQYVEGVAQKDWESAEHLIEYDGYYDYCVFIEYNTNPVVAGKGSAFFLHVGSEPTAGCVATDKESMTDTLCWLDKTQNPHILIY